MAQYYVYMMTSYRGVLYTGVTNDLMRRSYEHCKKLAEGFTEKYNATKLVYFESTADVRSAIEREKQIKRWRRNKKVALIESMNPRWEDLSAAWQEKTPPPQALRQAQGYIPLETGVL